ncbi:unnamed protein product, partial [Lymnaea stagnalis]
MGSDISRPRCGKKSVEYPRERSSLIDLYAPNFAFRSEALIAINEYRVRHAVPPLDMSEKLSAIADRCANKIVETGNLHYKPMSCVGQCIAWSSREISARELINQWYTEAKNSMDDVKKPDGQKLSGNLSQLLRKGSRVVGIGVSLRRPKDGLVCYLAYFYPPGNVDSQATNV